MEVIIYGKEGCTDCDRTRMLCQIQSIPFQYHAVGTDISMDALQEKVGQPVRSVPQIFIRQDDDDAYVGGYDALRHQLQARGRPAAVRPGA
jgi:glutaredoxin 1